jgi:type II secretory pathway pseudopilin PulG
MVVLIVVSAFAALVGPNIFKQIQQVKSVAEQKKLEFVLEHTKTIAFCRQSSFWVKMENNQLTVENSTGEAVKQIAFEFLHFNKEDVQFNANGFPSTSKIEYNRHGVPAVFWLQQ